MSSRIPGWKLPALRVAIIGAGLMGYWHGRVARRLNARLVGIADPNVERANALAEALRVDKTANDASEFLQDGRVDVVHICSPASTHVALACRAIESGIHAFVEKPLAESAEETRKVVDIARRKTVVLCPVHQIAFQEGVADAKKALAGLGELSAIDVRICSAGASGRAERELDEIVGEILPHPLSVLRKLWPDASWQPQLWHVDHPRPGAMLVSGEHAGGLLSMLVSLHARPTCFEMVVYGRCGAVQLDFFHGFAIRHDGRVSRLRKAARPFTIALRLFGTASVNSLRRGFRGELAYPGLRCLTRAFYAAVRGEAPSPIPAEDVIAVAAARDAILTGSHPTLREGRWSALAGGEKFAE